MDFTLQRHPRLWGSRPTPRGVESDPPSTPPFGLSWPFVFVTFFRRGLFCGSGFFQFGVFRVGCPFVVKLKRDRSVTNLVTLLYGTNGPLSCRQPGPCLTRLTRVRASVESPQTIASSAGSPPPLRISVSSPFLALLAISHPTGPLPLFPTALYISPAS